MGCPRGRRAPAVPSSGRVQRQRGDSRVPSPHRLDGAGREGRGLLGIAPGCRHGGDLRGTRFRPAARAAGRRVSMGRESHRGGTLRRHGPDDQRLRSAGPAAQIALPARQYRGVPRRAARVPVLRRGFRCDACRFGRGLRDGPHRGIHGLPHDCRRRGTAGAERRPSRAGGRCAMGRLPGQSHPRRVRVPVRAGTAAGHVGLGVSGPLSWHRRRGHPGARRTAVSGAAGNGPSRVRTRAGDPVRRPARPAD